MKICMYNVTVTIKIGGIETYYWEVSKELQSLGYDVEIVSGIGNSIKYEEIEVKQFPFTPRDKIFNLGNRFRKWGERVSLFLNARGYLKEQNFDLFLVRKPFDFLACYFMKRYNPKIKTVFVSGGEDFYGFDKFFARYVDHMFAVSNDNAKKIKQRYNREIKVIPNGVDIAKFTVDENQRDILRDKFNLKDRKVLISVGRVVGWKGFQLVIESLKWLEDFYYVLIGDGEYLNSLKQLAKDLGVDDRVLFIGAIDNKMLPNYLNMADIFIQPSVGHEAFGITIVEAMACGLPVVASRNGGIVDIVEDGKVGYLFEIENIKEMSQKILDVYENKKVLSQEAIKRSKENFTWKSCVDKLLKNIGEKV